MIESYKHINNLADSCKLVIAVAQSYAGIQKNSEEWVRVDHLFFFYIEKAKSDDLRTALSLDQLDDIPFYMKVEIHQKLLLEDGNNSAVLRNFATYLESHSNNWNYLAQYLRKVAEELDQ